MIFKKSFEIAEDFFDKNFSSLLKFYAICDTIILLILKLIRKFKMNNIPTRDPNQQNRQNSQRPAQSGQQRPVQNGQRPVQNGQRPVQNGQRPMQNGQRPVQNGQRPVQNGQRPMQNGQRPMQNGQRPMQNGQRPMPNGQRPMPNRPNPSRQGGSTVEMSKMILVISAILLVIAIIIGVVALAINADGDLFGWVADAFEKDEPEIDNDDDDDRPAKDDSEKETESTSTIKTTLQLPAVSPAKNYLHNDSSSVKQIEGVTSAAAVLVDMQSGKVTAIKQADTRIHPASMTKVMTLIVAAENLQNSSDLLTVEQWMIDYMIAEEGSGVSYSAGEQITVEDALYLISYKSDTIACLLVAEKVAGSEAAFVKKMNDKARALGLTNTHFANSTGLYESENDYNYTTCREMAAIMECAINNSAVKSIITSYAGRRVSVYSNGKESRAFPIYTRWYSYEKRFNDDPRIDGTNGKMKAIAGKTGGEDIPSSCFVTVAENTTTGDKYICVTVGRITQSDGSYVSEATSTSDTKKIYKNYAYNA